MHHHNAEGNRTIIPILQKLAQSYSPLLNMFQLLNFIYAYGGVSYGLARMLMSKNINDDVTMNPPLVSFRLVLYFTTEQNFVLRLLGDNEHSLLFLLLYY